MWWIIPEVRSGPPSPAVEGTATTMMCPDINDISEEETFVVEGEPIARNDDGGDYLCDDNVGDDLSEPSYEAVMMRNDDTSDRQGCAESLITSSTTPSMRGGLKLSSTSVDDNRVMKCVILGDLCVTHGAEQKKLKLLLLSGDSSRD